MWPRRIPKEEGCRELGKVLREALETSGAERYEDFLASAEPPVREHVMICEGCRAELSDALLVRRLLRGNVPATADPGRIFSTRVMNAIAEEEFGRRSPGGAWVAVPRLAARLAWASAIVLLLASSWLYEQRPARAVNSGAKNASTDVFLEPAPQPSTRDEVLLSLAEKEP